MNGDDVRKRLNRATAYPDFAHVATKILAELADKIAALEAYTDTVVNANEQEHEAMRDRIVALEQAKAADPEDFDYPMAPPKVETATPNQVTAEERARQVLDEECPCRPADDASVYQRAFANAICEAEEAERQACITELTAWKQVHHQQGGAWPHIQGCIRKLAERGRDDHQD